MRGARTAFERFRLAGYLGRGGAAPAPTFHHTHVVIEGEGGELLHIGTDEGQLIYFDGELSHVPTYPPIIDHGPTLPSFPPPAPDLGHVVIEGESGDSLHVSTDDGRALSYEPR